MLHGHCLYLFEILWKDQIILAGQQRYKKRCDPGRIALFMGVISPSELAGGSGSGSQIWDPAARKIK